MTEKTDKPLTPPELFRRGIEITQQIRGKIEETRAYYLGRSSRETEEPLSEMFERMTGKGRSADGQPDARADEPTDPRKELQTGGRQHAQKQKQNINLSSPRRWTVPIQLSPFS